jgi:hypothetical protein
MTIPSMNKLSTVFPIMIDKYEQFIPNIEGMGVPDKINAIIQYLNRIGKLSNDVVADWNKVMVWVMDEGLTDNVNAKIDDMVAKGTFDTLLNGMFDEINNANTAFQTTVNSSLAEMAQQDYIDITTLGVKADGITDDSNAFEAAIQTASSKRRRLLITGSTIRITRPILINDGTILNLIGIKNGRGGLATIWLDMADGSNGVLFKGNTSSGRITCTGELLGISFDTYNNNMSGRPHHTFMKDIFFQQSVIANCGLFRFKYIFDNVNLGAVTDIKDCIIGQIGKAVFTNGCLLGDARMFNNYFSGSNTYHPDPTTNIVRYPDFIDSNISTFGASVFSLAQINNNWFEFFTSTLNGISTSEVTGNVFDYCYNVLNASLNVQFTGNIINHALQSDIINNIQARAGQVADSVYSTGKSAIIILGTFGNSVSSNVVASDIITTNNTYFVRLAGGDGGQTGFIQYTKVTGNNFHSYTRDMIIDFSLIDFMNSTSSFNTGQLIGCDLSDLDNSPLTSIPQPTDKMFIPNSLITVKNEKLLGIKLDSSNLQGGATPYHLADMQGNLRNFKTQNLVNKFSGTGWSLSNNSPVISGDGLSVSFTPSTTGFKDTHFPISGISPNSYYRICANSPENNSNGILLEVWLYDSGNTKIGTWFCSINGEIVGLTPSNIDHFDVYLRKNLTTVAPFSIGMVSVNKFSTNPTRQIILGSKYRFAQYFDGTAMQYEPYI